jgi:hypothetical protein
MLRIVESGSLLAARVKICNTRLRVSERMGLVPDVRRDEVNPRKTYEKPVSPGYSSRSV